eukprot:COSAG02_NODE_6777_length_3366_cov_2.434956_2_plen_111_part_00
MKAAALLLLLGCADAQYDYSLEDQNPASASAGEMVGPTYPLRAISTTLSLSLSLAISLCLYTGGQGCCHFLEQVLPREDYDALFRAPELRRMPRSLRQRLPVLRRSGRGR